MSGSTFGKNFRVTTWGESHGKALGVVVDGCPAGLALSEAHIQPFLDRRKPGQSTFTTKRKESDTVHILSGVFQGKTTGTPISMVVYNEDQHSKDYHNLDKVFRPGHADFTFQEKYGYRDFRGGGRSSGRETVSRVMAGAVATLLLQEFGIKLCAFTKAIGPVSIPEQAYRFDQIFNELVMPGADYAEMAKQYLTELMAEEESAGGIIECIVSGLPAGIGEPVFDKIDARLAQAVLSIGSVKGVEFGDGFQVATAIGSLNNDTYVSEERNSLEGFKIKKSTNHSGGMLGGISDGAPLVLRAAIKPTPSISKPQQTVDEEGNPVTLRITGRHDPIIVPRAVVVVEAMVAITLVDLLLENMGSKLEKIKEIFEEDSN